MFKKRHELKEEINSLKDCVGKMLKRIDDLEDEMRQIWEEERVGKLEIKLNTEYCDKEGLKAEIFYVGVGKYTLTISVKLSSQKIFCREGYIWELEKIISKDSMNCYEIERIINAWKWETKDSSTITTSTTDTISTCRGNCKNKDKKEKETVS